MEPRIPARGPEAHRTPEAFSRLEKRDWELWSIVLLLFTVFAGGLIAYFYYHTTEQRLLSPTAARYLWLILFGLMALVLLLNIYLIDKKRTLAHLWRQTLAQESELEEQRTHAVTDSITQVYNRRFFDEVMPREIQRAARANRPLSVLLVDIDDFRQLNATLGHFVGDKVLRQVADTLKCSLRTSDYVFRFGSDEFLIVLAETNDAGAAVVTRRIHEALAARRDLQQRARHPVTVTIGPATFLAGRTLESVIEEAEARVQTARGEAARGTGTPG
ncbi:MAG: GGDEF domain-containing protein [Terriglobia bacterium]